jgi:serine/threonine protein kinase
MVWDLGCILIHLLVGSHRLKNLEMLNKFKGEEFSFLKIGVTVEKKYSAQLKSILGKMCHYNKNKRLTVKQLLLDGYFSN